MIGQTFHPGYAVLAAVGVVVAAAMALPVSQPTTLVATEAQPELISIPKKSAIHGVARVIDGDTIDVRGTRVRLNGIDAPEMKQTCSAGGSNYPCGVDATEALIRLLGSSEVDCEQVGRDRNGRVIGQCAVGSIDVGGWMVEHGWAIAYRRFSTMYVGHEDRARAKKIGMWSGSFTDPEEFRRLKREGASNE